MTAPVGLQLSRRKGFDLQALSRATNGLDAINVARPGKLGNPFTVTNAIEMGFAREETAQRFVVECFDQWLGPLSTYGHPIWWEGVEAHNRRNYIWEQMSHLRGKNLACWCGLDQPCHRNVLLWLANG
jgi:hypothetical protein